MALLLDSLLDVNSEARKSIRQQSSALCRKALGPVRRSVLSPSKDFNATTSSKDRRLITRCPFTLSKAGQVWTEQLTLRSVVGADLRRLLVKITDARVRKVRYSSALHLIDFNVDNTRSPARSSM